MEMGPADIPKWRSTTIMRNTPCKVRCIDFITHSAHGSTNRQYSLLSPYFGPQEHVRDHQRSAPVRRPHTSRDWRRYHGAKDGRFFFANCAGNYCWEQTPIIVNCEVSSTRPSHSSRMKTELHGNIIFFHRDLAKTFVAIWKYPPKKERLDPPRDGK
jgi:hypothetical protein